MNPKILILPGSNRGASYNRRLAGEAARLFSRTDAVVTLVNLADYAMPIYDGDMERDGGVPRNAQLLAQQIALHDGLMIVSPEYNSSIPPLLKNALDWTSRVRKLDDRPIKPFSGLITGLAAASPGRNGGQKGLEALRIVMRSLGAEVLTAQCTVAEAASAFDADGRLVEDRARLQLDRLVEMLVDTTRSLSRNSYQP